VCHERVVSDVLNATLDQVSTVLATKKRGVVALPGFGTFYTRTKATAQVRSIATGQPVAVPAHRVAGFRVGGSCEERSREGDNRPQCPFSAASLIAHKVKKGLTGDQRRRNCARETRRTFSPGTRWKSASVVTTVRRRSSAVAAIRVSTSPIRPGPWGGRNRRRISA
jgi:nucleoid DNA-binding protein